ncbi:HAUS augmin-like complex subunit 1 [Octodon degus]|uniref:HAUS augmin-like complex subunit 1 n=1 Tax=Octodon degus TaxID=10160 RepID=A0A6P3VAB9_OCTDE|nr:HAUS augmin-like complex subunit 1 [Octodon degus]
MEAQEEKDVQVAEWLKKIFGDHPIPQYEVNPRTTEILYHLGERNKARDRDACLVIEDLKQKASEYESEGTYRLLPRSSRSATINVDMHTSLWHDVFNSYGDTQKNFIPAVNDLTSDVFRTKSKNEELQLQLGKLERNLTATLVLEKCLQENLGLWEQLSARGMDASLLHQSLVVLSEKLAELKQKTIPLKKKLESYLDLMPNPSLAQVKIEEAKRELDTIEAELTKKVDMMEL